MRGAFLAVLAIALAGCASGKPNLCATARAISPRLDPALVTISDRKRGLTTSQWTALTPDGAYRCRGDYMYGAPACAPAPKPAAALPPPSPPPSVAPPPSTAPSTAPGASGC